MFFFSNFPCGNCVENVELKISAVKNTWISRLTFRFERVRLQRIAIDPK